jgi:predicted nucleic acid-binding Zn ribbon protein
VQHISPTLEGLLKDHRLQQGIADYWVFSRWRDIVGPMLAERTAPIRVADGTLWVHVENSTLLHHLGYLSPKMLARIRAQAPQTSVYRIRFTIMETKYQP